MEKWWKTIIACLLVLAVAGGTFTGCGGEATKEGVITIGVLTDFTGPSSPACLGMNEAFEDIVSYYNDEGLIPGAVVKFQTYDTGNDAAKYLPGYDYLKAKGMQTLMVCVSGAQEVAGPYAMADQLPIASFDYDAETFASPGWVFLLGNSPSAVARTLVEWLAKDHRGYNGAGVPKLGFVGWNEPIEENTEAAIREYCKANPDKFDYVGGLLVPLGTMTFGGEVQKLKDCDYIYTTFLPAVYFIKQYRDAGYHATFIGDSGSRAYYSFLVDMVGWKGVDGYMTAESAPWVNEDNPANTYLSEIIDRYRPGKTILDMGGTYGGCLCFLRAFMEIVRQAVADRGGASGYDGQAFYDAAVKFNAQYEGLPEYGFSNTGRILVHQMAVYEWSAAAEGLVRLTDFMTLSGD
ncbi:MAG: ABC transporter substrate-binding protein [Chloroflexi bacterium]|nr:ABC transporter substrate-binding protein [Chloroflexota bacterium]